MAKVRVRVQNLTTKEVTFMDVEESILNGTGGKGDASDISELTDTTGILTAKVDVVAGKGLSTNDLTDALETKLNDLPLAAELPTDISDLTDAEMILNVGTLSIVADEDLPPHRFIGFHNGVCHSEVKAKGVSGADTDADGFAIANGATGLIYTYGSVLVETAETIDQGGEVTSDANGKALCLLLTSKLNGYALEAATAIGQLIRVKLV